MEARVTLRFPDELRRQIVKIAGRENRSLNQQLVQMLQEGVKAREVRT